MSATLKKPITCQDMITALVPFGFDCEVEFRGPGGQLMQAGKFEYSEGNEFEGDVLTINMETVVFGS